MKKFLRKLRRTKKVVRYVFYILIVTYFISLLFFAKNILKVFVEEKLIVTIIIIILLLYLAIYIFWNLLNILQKKYVVFIITSILTVLLTIVFIISSYFLKPFRDTTDGVQESKNVLYTTYLINLKDSKFSNASKIGRINNKNDVEGYVLTEKLYVNKKLSNSIVDYDDYVYMLNELMKGNIDAVFVPSNYAILFSSEEGLENLDQKTKIIYEYSETRKNEDIISVSDKDFNVPLTFLVMGVDSEKDGLNANAAFNGDTLMLVAFNPDTLRATMVSLPRDTYVPIACKNNQYSKINSAAAGGTKCVVDTVSNFLDVDIDYYAKINFKGVVELVDAVGGIDVDVEKPDFNHHNNLGINCNGKFCEQNSNRGINSKDIIYIDPGWQHLNGEQALAYSRGRYLYAGGDLDRIKHQQQVVQALASKMLSFESIADFQKILSAVSNNMITNMDQEKILSGYNVIKKMLNNALKGDDIVTIDKAYLETYNLNVYVPSFRQISAAQGYYIDSLDDIKRALNETLGYEKERVIKTFSFSANKPYEVYSPGKGFRKKASASLLPNFVGKTLEEAEKFCNENNIEFHYRYVDPGSEYYNETISVGLIGNQSRHEKELLSTVDELTVYIVNSAPKNKEENKDNKENSKDQNKDNKENSKDQNKDNTIDDVIEDLIN